MQTFEFSAHPKMNCKLNDDEKRIIVLHFAAISNDISFEYNGRLVCACVCVYTVHTVVVFSSPFAKPLVGSRLNNCE